MLSDPRPSGMTSSELKALCAQPAPAQAAQAGQHNFQQRGDRRLKAPGVPGAPGRLLRSNADRILVTVIYLCRVCSQKVRVDLLAVNAGTIGEIISETCTLMDSQQITVSQTAARKPPGL